MTPERPRRAPGIVVFLVCWASYAYFWQSRDWNSASRLMLSYALVDRRTVSIDGYEHQCADVQRGPDGRPIVRGGDIAYHEGHFYSDKAPGLSFFGAIVYALLPEQEGLKPHPLDAEPMPYWRADYWVTLFTSGLATAAAAYIVYRFCLLLGAPCWAAVTAAFAYGLGSPAFVYGTLFYGHNLAGLLIVTGAYTLARSLLASSPPASNALLCGLLVGLLPVVEYPALLAAAILALAALFVFRRPALLLAFMYGAVMGAILLPVYNWKAFGSPFSISYEFEASRMFQQVHSPDAPLGVRFDRAPDFNRLPELLWKQRRGLLWYAPFFALAVPGVLVLLASRFWSLALILPGIAFAYLWVNLVYPAWDGGWCTGPRLLTATYPALAVLAGTTFRLLRPRILSLPAVLLMLAGIAVNLGCVAIGGRIPPAFERPLEEVVLPRWKGEQQDELSVLAGGEQFERNLGHTILSRLTATLNVSEEGSAPENAPEDAEPTVPMIQNWRKKLAEILKDATRPWSRYRALEFAPLLLFWAIGFPLAYRCCGKGRPVTA